MEDDVMDYEIDWRDLYRVPIMLVMTIPALVCFVAGFVLGVFFDAFEQGLDAAVSFGE